VSSVRNLALNLYAIKAESRLFWAGTAAIAAFIAQDPTGVVMGPISGLLAGIGVMVLVGCVCCAGSDA
jgi:hypothetical protein